MIITGGFIAVRENEEHEWPDTSTFSHLLCECKRKTAESDKQIPQYARANPVRRYIEVTMKEYATVINP